MALVKIMADNTTQKRQRGRPKGALNKRTAEVKELASEYAPEALSKLATLMREAENEQAQISACKEILDRAYGRAPQSVDVNARVSFAEEFENFLRGGK